MSAAQTPKLRGQGRLLRRVALIVLALVVIGIVADRAITSFWPRSWSRGTLTGTLEAVGGRAGAGPRPLEGTITATASDRTVLTLSVSTTVRFTVHPAVGTYVVTARSPQYGGGHGTCYASGPVTVREGMKTTVTVECREK
ncbi:MAG: hypothetical protein M0004_07785 [Actinomycetota bacterium]|nr:hypothetical protein [Actinomycetota bacterium]